MSDSLEIIRIRDRVIIQFCYNLSFNGATCYLLCKQAYPLDGPSRSLVYYIYGLLSGGTFCITAQHGGGVLPDWEFLLKLEDRNYGIPFDFYSMLISWI
jgi:hypothetical protein